MNFNTTVDISKHYQKSHNHVMRDIDNLVKTKPELLEHIKESEYTNTRNKKYRCYLLDEYSSKALVNKYDFKIHNPRFEAMFSDMLKVLFPNELILQQYHILDYRIDFFMPNVNLIIEYDEEHHDLEVNKNKDVERMNNIVNELTRMVVVGEPLYKNASDEPQPWLENKNIFSVIRVKKGEEIDGLRRICIEITENTMRPCSDFMY